MPKRHGGRPLNQATTNTGRQNMHKSTDTKKRKSSQVSRENVGISPEHVYT